MQLQAELNHPPASTFHHYSSRLNLLVAHLQDARQSASAFRDVPHPDWVSAASVAFGCLEVAQFSPIEL